MSWRKKYLAKHQLWNNRWECEHCHTETDYPEVDHIQKRSSHPELKYVEENLQILCHNCHVKETLTKQ